MRDSDESALKIICPECGTVERDEYEVIPARTLTTLRCWSCRARFSIWLDECRFCGEELVIAWHDAGDRGMPHVPAICPSCHEQGAFDEGASSGKAALA